MTAMRTQRHGGFLVAKIHQLGSRIFARLLKQHGIDELNPAQGRIMFVLWQEDGIPFTELARRTQLDKSTLTSMVDRLERAGLVQRVPSKGDRRQIILHRTQKDRRLESLYVTVSREMNEVFYKGLSAHDATRLDSDLARILANLEEYDADAK
jgi:MarR family transcriptional regulator, organic hydroperoxide resistance regulator